MIIGACQVIIWLSFEWSHKTLKCLQVTGLNVELRELGAEWESGKS